jgi:hypothetical protein
MSSPLVREALCYLIWKGRRFERPIVSGVVEAIVSRCTCNCAHAKAIETNANIATTAINANTVETGMGRSPAGSG